MIVPMHDVNEKLNLLLALGRFAEAEKAAREAIAAAPEVGGHYTHLARALINLDRNAEAEDAARRGIRYAPEDAWAHDILAFVQGRMKKYHAALAECEEVARLDPFWIGGYRTHSWILNQNRRFKDVLRVTSEGLRLDPNDWQLLKERGWAYYELKRFDEAEAVARDGLRLHPDQVVFHNLLACLMMSKADKAWLWKAPQLYRAAEEHFLECLRRDPTETAYQGNRRLNAVRHRRRIAPYIAFPIPLLFAVPTVLLMQFVGPGKSMPLVLFPLVSIIVVVMLNNSDAFTLAWPARPGNLVVVPATKAERVEGIALAAIAAALLTAAILGSVLMRFP